MSGFVELSDSDRRDDDARRQLISAHAPRAWYRRPGALISGIVLAAIIAVVLVLVFTHHGDTSSDSPGPAPSVQTLFPKCTPTYVATPPQLEKPQGMLLFFYISDLHLDPYYDPSVGPGSGCLCQRPAAGVQCPAGSGSHFGQYGCDSPPQLVQETARVMRSVLPDPDFILIAGDLTRHNADKLPGDSFTVVQGPHGVVANATQLITDAFPNVPLTHITPAIGNNDVVPDYYLNITEQPNAQLNRLRGVWNATLPGAEAQTMFSHNGYYAKQLHPKLRLVVLNTLLYSKSHHPDSTADEDPLQQFAWMESQLQTARGNGYKIILASHVGPNVGTYNYENLWEAQYVERYLSVASGFADVIAGQLFAHIHRDFMALTAVDAPASSSGVLAPMFTPLAVSPIYDNNPGFHVVAYDLEAGEIADFASYHADLTGTTSANTVASVAADAVRSAERATQEADARRPRPVGEFALLEHGHEMQQTPPASADRTLTVAAPAVAALGDGGATLRWACGYTARGLWGVPDLSGTSANDFLARLQHNQTLLQAFVQNEAARSFPCDSTCLSKQLCAIKHVKKANVDQCQAKIAM